MKLALLGADADSIALVCWAANEGGHRIVVAYESQAFETELTGLAPGIRVNNNWEELFLGSVADAVIIGRGGREAALEVNIDPAEHRADQLRKLTQAAVPMIVVCPACEAIVGFEIEMIRNDTKAVIVPYVPGEWRAAFGELQDFVSWRENSPLGPIEQIIFQREQKDRSREAVLRQLARDITLLRRLIGSIQTVTASGPPAAVGRDPLGPKVKELPSLANLSVSFTGEEGLAARWSVAPATRAGRARLSVIGERGDAILEMPNDGVWSLTVNAETETSEPRSQRHEAEVLFWQLKHAAAGEVPDEDAWLAACRDQEAAEAVDRSLARSRTIELFNESHSEEQSFKGVMAMGGCLLLMGALAVLFLVVLVESLQLPIRGFLVWRLWPVYLLVPIVVFLMLQFLQFAAKRR
ncbi:MAG TPA: hypothetical protein VGI40_01200 [Pirellulaceae bacterium]|jgi:hypothetical protein